jgi:cytochrome P450
VRWPLALIIDIEADAPSAVTDLEAVVHEVLRLGSVVRAVPRQSQLEQAEGNACCRKQLTGTFLPPGAATRDTTIRHPSNGNLVPIPKGVKAIIMLHESCMVESTDPKLGWATDPAQFSPERWLALDGSFDLGSGPSIPFVVGPRSCFGAKMAVSSSRVVTAGVGLTYV